MTVGLNSREPSGAEAEDGPVLTFQPEGGLEEAVDDLKERGVMFPAEISEHDWAGSPPPTTVKATTSSSTSRRVFRAVSKITVVPGFPPDVVKAHYDEGGRGYRKSSLRRNTLSVWVYQLFSLSVSSCRERNSDVRLPEDSLG